MGDKILFRTGSYQASNDYTMENYEGIWYPNYNSNTLAYTEIEFKKSDWESIPEGKRKDFTDFTFLQNEEKSTQTTCYFNGCTYSGNEEIPNIVVIFSTEPVENMQNLPDSSLTTMTASCYIADENDSSHLERVCTCTIKTFILKNNSYVENTDSSYIPDFNSFDGYISRVYEDHTNFKYKTQPFTMNVGTTGTATGDTIPVIVVFSNPSGFTLDDLVNGEFFVGNGKGAVTSIILENVELVGDVSDIDNPNFHFPLTFTYSGMDMQSNPISVRADIYTTEGQRPDTPITLMFKLRRRVPIIKV